SAGWGGAAQPYTVVVIREVVGGSTTDDEVRAALGSVRSGCCRPRSYNTPRTRYFCGRWAHTRKREDLLRVARAVEGAASILGLSAHLLAVGRKECAS